MKNDLERNKLNDLNFINKLTVSNKAYLINNQSKKNIEIKSGFLTSKFQTKSSNALETKIK